MAIKFGDMLKEIYAPVLMQHVESTRRLGYSLFGLTEPTPEEMEHYKDKQDKRRVYWADQSELHADNPIMQLHSQNSHGECQGCDYSGMEGEPPDWPCRTVALICTGDPDYYPFRVGT